MLGGLLSLTVKKNRKSLPIMKSIIYNIILSVLILVAFLGLFSEPPQTLPTTQWALSLIATKAIGFGAIYAIYRIIKNHQ